MISFEWLTIETKGDPKEIIDGLGREVIPILVKNTKESFSMVGGRAR
jgi:hypothetical protein